MKSALHSGRSYVESFGSLTGSKAIVLQPYWKDGELSMVW